VTVPPAAPRPAELAARPHWRLVDFISDLHLQQDEPATFAAWQAYLAGTPADAVFILGDLFDVWVGDDALHTSGFEARCAAVLHDAAARTALFFMHGNRDFLAGPGLMAATGATLLDDPTVLSFAQQRYLLTHGDALCLGDTDYLRFRAVVREAGWQQDFLAKPLDERRAIARGIRHESEARKQSGAAYADVDDDAACAWLAAAGARTLIHGHTHRPAGHDLGAGRMRLVLSDWDAAAAPPRAQVLRLNAAGALRRMDLPAA
jgi:UDP-2,3-diacylglucosamine hydrolase